MLHNATHVTHFGVHAVHFGDGQGYFPYTAGRFPRSRIICRIPLVAGARIVTMKLSPLYRLAESDVATVVQKHVGHWQNLEAQTAAPFSPIPGLTLADLTARLAVWQELSAQIVGGGHDELQQLYAQRDAYWGQNAKDSDGAWYWLGFYKKGAQGRLSRLPKSPAVAALMATIPNLGNAQGTAIPGTFERFGAHWDKVNAALTAATPPAPPLVLGQAFDVAALQAAQSGWLDKQSEIEQTQGEVPQWRAQRDVVLGDFAAGNRETDSIISMLTDYHFGVETMFPDSTYAATLPRIFPAQTSDKEPPRFPYNTVEGADGLGVTVEFQIELGSLATLCFLKEGDFEQVKPIAQGAGCKHIEFENVHIVDGIDRLELRDEANKIVASGQFDANFRCA